MANLVDDFNDYRSKMNEKLLAKSDLTLKRIFAIDSQAYSDGALPSSTKEMLGLVASMVLRCDDCIKYHLEKCHQQGITTDQIIEIFSIANLVGGTIVIPHTRRAFEFWEELNKNAS
jgi:AhpD family alkylhydroperoxidase